MSTERALEMLAHPKLLLEWVKQQPDDIEFNQGSIGG